MAEYLSLIEGNVQQFDPIDDVEILYAQGPKNLAESGPECLIEHQGLFLLKHGHWILRTWMNYLGTEVEYCEITSEEAVRWIAENKGGPWV